MVRVVRAMTGIVDEGRAAGQFGPVDPILLYLTTVWPIVVYLATTPIRSAIARVAHFDVRRLDPDRFIRAPADAQPTRPHAHGRRRGTDRRDVMTQHSARATWITRIAALAACAAALAPAAACREKPPADRVRVSGYVEATEVRVAPEVGGRLIELKVAEGDRVKAGDVIAQLDTADITLALQRAAAERQGADAQLRLLLAGARQEDIRQAEAQRAAAEADLAARAPGTRLRRARPQALRGAARLQLRRARSRATMRRRGGTWRATACGPAKSACGPRPKRSRG